MFNQRIGTVCKLATVAIIFFVSVTNAFAQPNTESIHYKVTSATERITLVASSSQVLTMEYDVPYVVVGNQEVIKANPISQNQILVTAVKPGISALSMTDPDNNPHTIEIHVIGDVRALQATLDDLYPESDIHARALGQGGGVVLTGFVSKAADVPQIMEVTRDYFPNAINGLNVASAQKVMLKVKVVEVSRTKLRKLGIDWAALTNDFNLISNAAGLINTSGTGGIATMRAAVTSGNTDFNLLIDTLEQNNLAKILAEPNVTAVSGRPAGFHSGGVVPVPVNSGLGVQSVSFQPFGTKLDFVPIVLGNGRIRLEVRSEVSDVAGDLRDPVTGAPGFRVRSVDTGVEMKVGHTLALAGLLQNRVDSQERGLPIMKDMPVIGAAFRRVEDTFNEVELVILITPYFVNEVEDHMIPTLPGRATVVPDDNEFYLKGYREVPRCNNEYDLGPIGSFGPQATQANAQYQQAPQYQQQQQFDQQPYQQPYSQPQYEGMQVPADQTPPAIDPNDPTGEFSNSESQRRPVSVYNNQPASNVEYSEQPVPRPTLFGIDE